MIPANGYQMVSHKERFINCTFVWWADRNKTMPYSLTPVMSEGKVLCNDIFTNDDSQPISMFCIYNDNTCGIEHIKDLTSRNDIQLAVAGIHLKDDSIDYTGFEYKNIPSLAYATDRIAIAYNKDADKVCLISCKDNLTTEEFRDRLKIFNFTNILGLDSGKSAQWKFDESARLTGRYMIGWLYY